MEQERNIRGSQGGHGTEHAEASFLFHTLAHVQGDWAMMTVVAFLVFGSAFAVSLTVIVHTLAPAMPRIISLLTGHDEAASMPHLVLRDRRLASRSRSTHFPAPQAQRAAA